MQTPRRKLDSSFDINASVVHLLHRADQCTGETFSSRLGHRELTPRQFAVLMAVAARASATQTTITADTGIDRSTMVDVVRRLLKRGLLQRRRSRTDARAYVVRLTEDGQRVIDAAQPEAEAVDHVILSSLEPREREAFLASLGKIVDALAAGSEPQHSTAQGSTPAKPREAF